MAQKLSEDYIRRNLKDAGCNDEQICHFIQSYKNNDSKKQLRILKCHRCSLREDVHVVQKKIDCLDYLIYLLNKEEKRNG